MLRSDRYKPALAVAEKNNLAALARIQYERTRQKREEIVSELYVAIKDLERKSPSVGIPMPAGAPMEEHRRANSEFSAKLSEVRSYLDINAIWLDARALQATEELLRVYEHALEGYGLLMSRIERPRSERARTLPERERAFSYAPEAHTIRDDARKELEPLLEALPKYYKESLGIWTDSSDT
jgi:hypothetical protein